MKNKQLAQLTSVFLEHATPQRMADFLQAILTPKELAELHSRLEIVRLLKQGLPQREIADQLGVGIATVTRGSRELQLGRFRHV